jgi:rsbT co-antagonist protein RsbR
VRVEVGAAGFHKSLYDFEAVVLDRVVERHLAEIVEPVQSRRRWHDPAVLSNGADSISWSTAKYSGGVVGIPRQRFVTNRAGRGERLPFEHERRPSTRTGRITITRCDDATHPRAAWLGHFRDGAHRTALNSRKESPVAANAKSRIPDIVQKHEQDLLAEWVRAQAGDTRRDDLIKESEVREQSREFLALFREAVGRDGNDVQSSAWESVRDMLRSVSETRTQQGFSPTEIATFVFSFKQPLFARLRNELGQDGQALADETWTATKLLDSLGLYTAEVFQKTREEVIGRQQQEMMELSTPVVKLWDGVLALPMIGTLDSGRTQVVMESLLNRIVESGAEIAILDITGVPTVDTLVAQHLIKTVTAARLMGADCIISGIRPQIAQTIVHLGVDLKDIITKASLADAFALALKRKGMRVVRSQPAGA